MITWLLTNCLLSLLALGFIQLNTTSPHRLRFLVSFTALCSWLVPWQKLSISLPFTFSGLQNLQQGVEAPLPLQQFYFEILYGTGIDSSIDNSMGEPGLVLLLVAALPGLGYFLADHIRQRRTLKRLAIGARDGDYLWKNCCNLTASVPVLIQNEIPGAFTSGIVKPTIWVHEELVKSPDLQAILIHENTHIKHFDNLFLVIITFVEKLFWWNPVARILATRARALQELSCDEFCSKQLHNYREMLASLILGNLYRETDSRSLSLAANMFTKKNADVERIRLMERRYFMKPRHIASTVSLMGAAVLSISLLAADGHNVVTDVVNDKVLIFNLEQEFDSYDEDAFTPHRVHVKRLQVNGDSGSETEEFETVYLVPEEGNHVFAGEPLNYTAEDHGGKPRLTLKMRDVPLINALTMLADTLKNGIYIPLEDHEAISQEELRTFLEEVNHEENRMFIHTLFEPGQQEDSLIVEDGRALDILVSVDAQNKTIEEVVDLIAIDSGCNIYIDGKDIIVDLCSN